MAFGPLQVSGLLAMLPIIFCALWDDPLYDQQNWKFVSSQLLRNIHCLFWNDIHLDIVLSRVLVQAIPPSHMLYAFLGSIASNYEFLDVLLNHIVQQGEWYFCNPVLLLLMTITLDQIILISILLIRDISHSPISDLTAMNVNGKVLMLLHRKKSRHFGSDTAANIVFKALFVECTWVSCTSLFHFHVVMIYSFNPSYSDPLRWEIKSVIVLFWLDMISFLCFPIVLRIRKSATYFNALAFVYSENLSGYIPLTICGMDTLYLTSPALFRTILECVPPFTTSQWLN